MNSTRWATSLVFAIALAMAALSAGCGMFGRGKSAPPTAQAPSVEPDVGVRTEKAEGAIRAPAPEGAPAPASGPRQASPSPVRPAPAATSPPPAATSRREPTPVAPAPAPTSRGSAYTLLLRGLDARRLPEIAELQKRYPNAFTLEVTREGQASEVRVRFDERSTESVKALLDLLARPR